MSASFTKKSDKYSDVFSTAILFLIFGIAGIIYTILCIFNVTGKYRLFNNPFQYTIAIIMFVIFTAIGIASYIQSRVLKKGIAGEENSINLVNAYLKENLTLEYISNVTSGTISKTETDAQNDAEVFFIVSESISKDIKNQYPDIDPELILDAIDTYYNNNF